MCSEDLEIGFSILNDKALYAKLSDKGVLYDKLNKVRNDQFGIQIQNYQKFLVEANRKHAETEKYIEQITNGNS